MILVCLRGPYAHLTVKRFPSGDIGFKNWVIQCVECCAMADWPALTHTGVGVCLPRDTFMCNTILCNTAERNTIPCNADQCNTEACNTVKRNTEVCM